MTKKMIIDASHPEETRVALIGENNRLTDFDFESTTKQTVKGNIYLAKVARVEPSLQAAFVDYGGNRHGFLAFNEIHPDYFRIPISDREALKADLQATIQAEAFEENFDEPVSNTFLEETSELKELPMESLQDSSEGADLLSYDMPVDALGGTPSSSDEDEVMRPRAPHLHQKYKIQEVIQKNQILLVQVIKEERGGKGAALSTFLSLPGRYCVLMPNSPRSGGISRKISSQTDRSRLKKVLEELAIPDGMGLIIRTAGRERTKIEIKRDAEFLMRAWNGIRDLTLQSISPAAVYEEDDIIKRAIRDLYTKDVDEILVEGEEGYKIARSFMKNLMPSHLKRVQHYKDQPQPLFNKFKVEAQIDEMHTPFVNLASGGSLVIHPTEALVSIDINSGRSTRERHIEETAVKTNLEAADELARQIRLRDLAGLVVIDFIDMDDHRHIAAVERRLREAFRFDRARVQMGKIGPFGLLELSRQRLRPSLLETSTHPCPHCHATGFIRSTESTSLYILRLIEEEASSGKTAEFQIHVPLNIALYLLNAKRDHLQRLEAHHRVKVYIESDDQLISPQYRLTRLKRRSEDKTDIGLSMSSSSAPSVVHDFSLDILEEELENPLSVQTSKEIIRQEMPDAGTNASENRSRNRRRRRPQRHRSLAQNGDQELTPLSPLSNSDRVEDIPSENFRFEKMTIAGSKTDPSTMNPFTPELETEETSAIPPSSGETRPARKRFRSRRQRRPYGKEDEMTRAESSFQKNPEGREVKNPFSETLQNTTPTHFSDSSQKAAIQRSEVEQLNVPPSASSADSSFSTENTPQKKKSKSPWWKKVFDLDD